MKLIDEEMIQTERNKDIKLLEEIMYDFMEKKISLIFKITVIV